MTLALILVGLLALAASIAILASVVKFATSQINPDDLINWDDCL